jgi:hypothetical protein
MSNDSHYSTITLMDTDNHIDQIKMHIFESDLLLNTIKRIENKTTECGIECSVNESAKLEPLFVAWIVSYDCEDVESKSERISNSFLDVLQDHVSALAQRDSMALSEEGIRYVNKNNDVWIFFVEIGPADDQTEPVQEKSASCKITVYFKPPEVAKIRVLLELVQSLIHKTNHVMRDSQFPCDYVGSLSKKKFALCMDNEIDMLSLDVDRLSSDVVGIMLPKIVQLTLISKSFGVKNISYCYRIIRYKEGDENKDGIAGISYSQRRRGFWLECYLTMT